MSSERRLSICYVVPGHDLLASVGPSRNVVNLAAALRPWADVTVAFRRVADEHVPDNLRVLEIQPGRNAAVADDAAMRGIGYGDFLAFIKALRQFARTELQRFDVVLEKSWLLSGYVSGLCAARGQLGIPIENIVVNPAHAARQKLAKLVRLRVAHWIAARALRKAPVVIAETEFLKKEIERYWGVAAERIRVVDLGVDRTLFRPQGQLVARQSLGVDANKVVLVYVGVLDFTHDLEPAIRALSAVRHAPIELHLVGSGVREHEYRTLAEATGARLVFHGRVPHAQVPTYIALADLCLAPYDAAAFSSGELGYSTMKIPEYLSSGRPVVSVPSGRIRTLVQQGETGFLFANTVANWETFLRDLPPREHLAAMGEAAAATRLTSWEDTARNYLAVCEEHLNRMPRRST